MMAEPIDIFEIVVARMRAAREELQKIDLALSSANEEACLKALTALNEAEADSCAVNKLIVDMADS